MGDSSAEPVAGAVRTRSLKPLAYAVLSALLYVAAYPAGFGIWVLACVALVPLLMHVQRDRPQPLRALSLGFVFSLLVQLIGYAFLPATLLRFSGLPWLGCVLAYFALCAVQAGGVALWLSGLAFARSRGHSALVLAAPLWVAVELSWPAVFEAPLGAALHNEPGLLQSAELGGVGLVSLLLVALNASVAAYALARRAADRAAERRAALAFTLVSLIFASGLARFFEVQGELARAPRLRIGLVQANLEAEQKRRDPRAYVESYTELTALIRDPVDLLIWPETALARPVPTDVPHMRSAHESLTYIPAPLLTGAVVQDGLRLYNSALLFDASRARAGRVDKQALLPFAEQLPFGEAFPGLYDWIPGAGRFTAGTAIPVMALGQARLAALICYEDMLPGLVRRAVVEGRATLLVSLSNDAWFGESQAAYTHYAIAKLRAVELRRSLVRATNTGVTAVIAPSGAVTALAPERAAAALVATVPLMSVETPYARWGHGPLLAIMLAWLLAGLRRKRGPRYGMPADVQPA